MDGTNRLMASVPVSSAGVVLLSQNDLVQVLGGRGLGVPSFLTAGRSFILVDIGIIDEYPEED